MEVRALISTAHYNNNNQSFKNISHQNLQQDLQNAQNQTLILPINKQIIKGEQQLDTILHNELSNDKIIQSMEELGNQTQSTTNNLQSKFMNNSNIELGTTGQFKQSTIYNHNEDFHSRQQAIQIQQNSKFNTKRRSLDSRHQYIQDQYSLNNAQNIHNHSKSQYLINVICNNDNEDVQTPQHQIIQVRNQSINNQQNNEVLQSYFEKTFQLQTFGCQVSKRQLTNVGSNVNMRRKNSPRKKQSIDTKKVISKTLKNQNNCFLPNYKQNTVMQRMKQNNKIYHVEEESCDFSKLQSTKMKTKSMTNKHKNQRKQKNYQNFTELNKQQENLYNQNQQLQNKLRLSGQNILQQSFQNSNETQNLNEIDKTFSDNQQIKVEAIYHGQNNEQFLNEYYNYHPHLQQNAKNSRVVNLSNKKQSNNIQNSHNLGIRKQDSSQLQGWKLQKQTSSPSYNTNYVQNNVTHEDLNKSEDIISRNNRHYVNLQNQTSSKMSLDHPSPLNTELAMFDDLRQLQPRNFHHQNSNNLTINSNQRSINKNRDESLKSKFKNKNNIILIEENNSLSQTKEIQSQKGNQITSLTIDSQQQIQPHQSQRINQNDNLQIMNQNSIQQYLQSQISKDNQDNIIKQQQDVLESSPAQQQQQDYLSRSIEVVIQRTSQSNSKITSIKESTPNNYQYRNIYGNSAYIMTPNNINSSLNSKLYEQLQLGQQLRKTELNVNSSSNKKVILKKQQVKNGMITEKEVFNNRRKSPSQRTQVKKLETILMNNDLTQVGIQIRQKPIKSSKTYRPANKLMSQNIDSAQRHSNDNNSNTQEITLKFEQQKSEQISEGLIDDFQQRFYSSNTVKGINQYETGTQDSQIQKGIYDNKYEINDGSPFIYRSKESPSIIMNNKVDLTLHQVLNNDNKIVNVQTLQIPNGNQFGISTHSRHIQSHSVTPLCEPIYPLLTTNSSKDQLIKVQEEFIKSEQELNKSNTHQKHMSSIEPKINYFNDINKNEDDDMIQQQQQDVQVSMIDITQDDIDVNIDYLGQDINNHISSSLQNNNILENNMLTLNQQALIQQLNQVPMSLQQRIQIQRKLIVTDQTYKYNPFIYQRKQEEEESRLLQTRLKQSKERQSQQLGVQGTNIKTIAEKVQNATNIYQCQLQQQIYQAINEFNQKHQQSNQIPQVQQLPTSSMYQSKEMSNQFLLDDRIKQCDSQSFVNSEGYIGQGSSVILLNNNQVVGLMKNKYSIVSGQNQINNKTNKFHHQNSSLIFQTEIGDISPKQKKDYIVYELQSNISQKQLSRKSSPQMRKRFLSSTQSKIGLIDQKNQKEKQTQNNEQLDTTKYFYSPTPNIQQNNDLTIINDLPISGFSKQNISTQNLNITSLNIQNELTFDNDSKVKQIDNTVSHIQDKTQSIQIENSQNQQFQIQDLNETSQTNMLNQDSQNQSLIETKNNISTCLEPKFNSTFQKHSGNDNSDIINTINQVSKINLNQNIIENQSQEEKQIIQVQTIQIKEVGNAFDSQQTSFRITKPQLGSNLKDSNNKQEQTPKQRTIIRQNNFEGRHTFYPSDLTFDQSPNNRKNLDELKVAKSYSKLHSQIGTDLRNIAPKSVKNLGYLTGKHNQQINNSYSNNNRHQVFQSFGQFIQADQSNRTQDLNSVINSGKRKHEIHVNLAGSISTASFKNENQITGNDNSLDLGIRIKPNSKILRSKTNQIKNKISKKNRYEEIQQKLSVIDDNLNESTLNRQSVSKYQSNPADESHILFQDGKPNQDQKIFDDLQQQQNKLLAMKTTRLTQRLDNITKQTLHNSFIHNNRKVITTQNNNRLAQSLLNIEEEQQENYKNKQELIGHRVMSAQHQQQRQKVFNLSNVTSQNVINQNQQINVYGVQSNTSIINPLLQNTSSKSIKPQSIIQAPNFKQARPNTASYQLRNSMRPFPVNQNQFNLSQYGSTYSLINHQIFQNNKIKETQQSTQQSYDKWSLSARKKYDEQQSSKQNQNLNLNSQASTNVISNNYDQIKSINLQQQAQQKRLMSAQVNRKQYNNDYKDCYQNNTNAIAHQNRTSINSNKLQIFKKLKKGNVFKDEFFEAKQPSNGIKIISLY